MNCPRSGSPARSGRSASTPTLEEFPLSRVDPLGASVVVNGRTIEGLPLFDGGVTGAAGISGPLGALNSDAPIGLCDSPPNGAEAGALGDARRQNRHQAIVVVTRGARPGFCPSNADSFLQPFGPPVLQVASEEAPFLADCARAGRDRRADRACRAHAGDGVQRRHGGAGNGQEPCAAGRDDAAQRMVELRERARRRPRLLAGDHARGARRRSLPGTFCLSPQAAMRSVISGLMPSWRAGTGLVADCARMDSSRRQHRRGARSRQSPAGLRRRDGIAAGRGDDAKPGLPSTIACHAALRRAAKRSTSTAAAGATSPSSAATTCFTITGDRGADVVDLAVIERFAGVFATVATKLAGE